KEEKPLSLEEAAPEVVQLREAFRDLAAKAKPVQAQCKERSPTWDPDLAPIRGKAIIWDAAKDDVSEAHGKLPADVRAQDVNEEVTVFLIVKQDLKHMTNYNWDIMHGGGGAGVAGYRIDSTICVIGMPEKKPI